MRKRRRSIVYTFEVDVRGLAEALQRVAEGAGALARFLERRRAERARAERALSRHAFSPTLDLVCRECGVGPEECKGGRP